MLMVKVYNLLLFHQGKFTLEENFDTFTLGSHMLFIHNIVLIFVNINYFYNKILLHLQSLTSLIKTQLIQLNWELYKI